MSDIRAWHRLDASPVTYHTREAVHVTFARSVLVKAVVHSSRILSAFRSSGEALPLREVAARSGLPKSMTFRLLYTLERCGMIEKVGENLYRSSLRPFKQKLYRLGYAAQGTDYQFSKEVSAGLRARRRRSRASSSSRSTTATTPKIAQRNADVLVREKVDLVIEFQTDEHVAPIVAAKYREANIPLIAIEIPHPGATYFGANNYEAGLIGGRYLGRWAKQQWHADVDEIVLIALEARRQPAADAPDRHARRDEGSLSAARALPRHLPRRRRQAREQLRGDAAASRASSRARRFLVGAINDPSALGALRAFQEAGRTESCAIMGQNASPEGRAELREPGTRLIGSVAYFPEKYGSEIVAVALDILHRRPVPPAVFVKHQLVTPENVNHIYPNDELMHITAGAPA